MYARYHRQYRHVFCIVYGSGSCSLLSVNQINRTAFLSRTQRILDIAFTINDKIAVSTVNEHVAANMAFCITRISGDICGYTGKPLINQTTSICEIRIDQRLCRYYPTEEESG